MLGKKLNNSCSECEQELAPPWTICTMCEGKIKVYDFIIAIIIFIIYCASQITFAESVAALVATCDITSLEHVRNLNSKL